MSEISRTVCQFSCGAASAVATKITIATHEALSALSDTELIIVNAYIKEEHVDNRRFYADCQKWFGWPITTIQNDKYGASTHEVWRQKRYIKGMRGAPCSLELKRKMLATFDRPGDVKVIGFTKGEEDRYDDLCERFPKETFHAPLIEAGLSKEDCFAIVDRAGIKLPEMYLKGYNNANCIGCPKGGQSYWQNIRADFPEEFVQIKAIQEDIGPGAYFLRFRSGPRKGERMSLADLPVGQASMKGEPSFSCSFFCEIAENEIYRP